MFPALPSLEPLIPLGGLNVPRVAQHAAPPRPLTPDEERSLLETGLSFLEYGAETLDKPGAAVRGMLAGHPEAALNLIPFSDTLGITDPEDRVYGRDLLEQWGALAPNRPGLDWGDVAGFGVEVALDPLTMVGGPAKSLTKAGLEKFGNVAKYAPETLDALKPLKEVTDISKVRKLAGTSPAAYADEIEEGLRGIISFGAPWPLNHILGDDRLVLGAGSAKAANTLRNLFYGNGKYLIPPLLAPMRYLFDHRVKGQWAPSAQRAADMAYTNARNAAALVNDALPALARRADQLEQVWLKDLVKYSEAVGQKDVGGSFDVLTRNLAEHKQWLTEKFGSLEEGMRQFVAPDATLSALKNPAELESFMRSYHELVDGILTTKDFLYQQALDLGLDAELLDDLMTGHMPRRPGSLAVRKVLTEDEKRQRVTGKLLGHSFDFGLHRTMRDVPGGTLTIERVATDPMVRGVVEPEVAKQAGEMASRSFGVGDVVFAADRGNYGRVRSTGKTSAEVRFRSPEGAIEDVRLPLDQLKRKLKPNKAAKAVGDYVKFSADNHADALKAWFRDHGLKVDEAGSLGDLLEEYVWQAHLWPAANRMGEQRPEVLRHLRETFTPDVDIPHPTRTVKVWDAAKHQHTEVPDVWFKAGEGATSKAKELAKWARHLPDETATTGLFNRPMLTDIYDYMEGLATVYANLSTTHNFIRGVAVLGDQEGHISLNAALATAAQTKNGPRARNLLSARGRERLVNDFFAQQGAAAPDNWREAIKSIYVPENTPGVLRAYAESFEPSVTPKLVEYFDKITNLWKGAQTVLFPAFHARNKLASIWQHWSSGEFGLGELLREEGSVMRTLAKRGGYGDLPYIQDLRHGEILGVGHGKAMEFAGPKAAGEAIVGGPEQGLLGYMTEPLTDWSGGGKKMLLGIRGRGVVEPGAVKDIVSDLGDRMYTAVEFTNRYVPYKLLRDKGYSHAVAAHKVNMMDFDYSQASPFIKTIGRRLVPFIQWTTKNIPYQLWKLANEPGGRAAQTLRGTNLLRDESDEYMPTFLREGSAIRIGGDSQNAQFIRWLGIPIEDLGLFRFEGNLPAAGKTAVRAAAQLHPLAQWPLEAFSGTDLYTGRPLKNLKGMTGNVNFDLALSGMPWARLQTTLQSLADPRKTPTLKALNALTGIKVGTYDLPKLKMYELREALNKQMADMPEFAEFTTQYIPKDRVPEASPKALRSREQARALARAISELRKQRQTE